MIEGGASEGACSVAILATAPFIHGVVLQFWGTPIPTPMGKI